MPNSKYMPIPKKGQKKLKTDKKAFSQQLIKIKSEILELYPE